MSNFRAQAARFGADLIQEKATRVDISERPFRIWTGDPSAPEPSYVADALIVATGAQSLMLDLPSEHRLLGHGLSTCATCDGFFFKGHEIVVASAGVPASKRPSSSRSSLRRSPSWSAETSCVRRRSCRNERSRTNESSSSGITWSIDLRGDARLQGIDVENVQTGEKAVLPVTGS